MTKLLNSSQKQRNSESEIDCWRENFSWGENPESHLPEKWALAITIWNNNEATQSRTLEMDWGIQIY